jgi:uncharacterized membrane protein
MKKILEKGKLCLHVFTMIIILLSSINGIKKYLEILFFKEDNDEKQLGYYELRIFVSESLVLALTFLLGAEIIETIINPSFRSLIGVATTFTLRLIITFVIDRDINLLNVEKDELEKDGSDKPTVEIPVEEDK